MTSVLIAVVVIVGVVAAADLLLSFAVVRRLATLQARVSELGPGPVTSPAIGHRVGDFTADLLDGGTLTSADLAGIEASVLFVSPSCEPCRALLAEIEKLPSWPERLPLFVMINDTGDEDYARSLVAKLPGAARVARVRPDDEVSAAFGVIGYPTVIAVDSGIVRASGIRLSALDLVSA